MRKDTHLEIDIEDAEKYTVNDLVYSMFHVLSYEDIFKAALEQKIYICPVHTFYDHRKELICVEKEHLGIHINLHYVKYISIIFSCKEYQNREHRLYIRLI